MAAGGALLLAAGLLALAGCRQAPAVATTAAPPVAPVPAAAPTPSVEPAATATLPNDWLVPTRYHGKLIGMRVRHFPTKLLALTFDDGPDPRVTPLILDTLSRYGAHATFFVLGDHTDDNQQLLRREVAEGHAIGIHSWDHLARYTPEQAANQLERTARAIEHATGRRPTIMRPPYGITKNGLTRKALALGYPAILWTISSADTTSISAQVRANNVIHTPNPGDIVLMHDGGGNFKTADALPLILEELGQAGYRFVTVPELLRAWDEWLAANPPAVKPAPSRR